MKMQDHKDKIEKAITDLNNVIQEARQAGYNIRLELWKDTLVELQSIKLKTHDELIMESISRSISDSQDNYYDYLPGGKP